MPGIKPLLAGRSSVSGTLPSTPSTGQPSSHFTARDTECAHRAEIAEQVREPFAARRIDHAALRDAFVLQTQRPSHGPVILSAR
jgi:hypothetical protein